MPKYPVVILTNTKLLYTSGRFQLFGYILKFKTGKMGSLVGDLLFTSGKKII